MTNRLQLSTASGPMELIEARPETPRAAAVLLQEGFGLTGHIEDVAGRLARAGYHVVAPELFHRQGRVVAGYDDLPTVLDAMQKVRDDEILADVDAALGHLHAAGWSSGQIGVIGFCMGGRSTFLVAANRALGAAVTFYGSMIVTPLMPNFPPLVDAAPRLKTPWLGLFGDLDQSIPVADVERLRTDTGRAPVPCDVVRYPDAGHGFHCDERPDFNPAAARDGWSRALAWFERNLATPTASPAEVE